MDMPGDGGSGQDMFGEYGESGVRGDYSTFNAIIHCKKGLSIELL